MVVGLRWRLHWTETLCTVQLAGEWRSVPSVQNNVGIFNIPGVASTMAGLSRP